MKLTITIEEVAYTPELLAFLQSIGQTPVKADDITPAHVKEITKAAPVVATTATTASSPVVKDDKPITVESLRELVTEKVGKNKRSEVKALLTRFGAENVSKLDKAKYAEFNEELNAL
ncbi:MAG: hypothetical protein WCG90_08355 [Chitinophagia bacterium]